MKIRTRLTIQFAFIVAAVLFIFSLSVYFLFARFRQQDFYSRIKDRALNTSKLLIEIKEVNTELQDKIDHNIFFSLINERMDIYNKDNLKIYSISDTLSYPVTDSLLNKIRAKKELEFREGEREVIGIATTIHSQDYVILCSAYDKYGFNKLRFLRLILIALFFTSMIIIVIMGRIFSRQALQPISKVVREVDNISISNLDIKVNEGNGTDEIAQLAITFNKMLSRLNSSFDLQKNFVSNASHELRTPLTALSGQISVALLQDRSTDEYKALLQSLSDDIHNMSNLINQLLELAMVSRDVSELNFSNIRIDEVLLNARGDILKLNPAYKIQIHYESFNEKESAFLIKGNEQLLKSAFVNLMDNGCKFSLTKKSDVLINIDDYNNYKIVFKDNGIGIPENDLEKIFDPLYRSNNAKQLKGHGLGLALTQKIIHVHNGTIKISSKEGKGTSIEVTLPGVSEIP